MKVLENMEQVTLVEMAFAVAVNNLHAKAFPNFEEVLAIFDSAFYRCSYSGGGFTFSGSCKIEDVSLMVVIIHTQQSSTGKNDFRIDPYFVKRLRDVRQDYALMHQSALQAEKK